MSSDEESYSGSEGENEEEEVDQRLSNGDVFNKYKSAGVALNDAMRRLISECTAGKKILELCELGDKYVKEETAKPYSKQKKLERGVAFPTSLSVNNIVSHFSPEVGDTSTLTDGDLVKLDMGAHIDGFIAVAAHTFIVGSGTDHVEGKKADLICALNIAADIIIKHMKIGKSTSDVTKVIKKVGEAFHVNPVEGVLSHQMKRFVIDSTRVIINKVTTDQSVEESTFEEDDVWQIDIVYSTGEGKLREENFRPAIFKRVTDNRYHLKIKASRELNSEVTKKFPALPFSIRGLEQKHVRFGLSEMEKHGLINAYPILFEKQGELVAQIKFTVLVTPNGAIRTTNQPIPFVKSEYKLDDPELNAFIQSGGGGGGASGSAKKKKKSNKKQKLDDSAPQTTTTTTTSSTTEQPNDPMETN